MPAVAGRHRQVGLAGAGLDLVEDLLAQLGQVRGALLGVGVLRLEVRRDLGRVLVPQPLVVVDAGLAVDLGGHGPALRDRRHDGGVGDRAGSVDGEVSMPGNLSLGRSPGRGGYGRAMAPDTST